MTAPATVVTAWLDALHLASPALPIGGFAYSQGLEQAQAAELVHDRDSAARWIRDCLLLVLAQQELPGWLSCHAAASQRNWGSVLTIHETLASLRESAELRLESRQMAYSLTRLYVSWLEPNRLPPADVINTLQQNFTAAHAVLCACRGLTDVIGLTAYVWAWLESQVLAAVKLVPLGQAEGQRLLHELKPCVQQALDIATQTPFQHSGSAAIGLSIVSSYHETQYSRLFRS